MKALVFLSLITAATSSLSQGTVNFANGAAGVDAPLTNGSVTPNIRADSSFRAQLYAGPAGSPASALTTNGVSGTPATFLSGGGAGYFLGNARQIDGYLPGTTVTLQVRAWILAAGPSWESAGPNARVESNLIQVTLGGGTIPTPNMLGLSWSPVPEPSSTTLAVIAGIAFTMFGLRRRAPRG